MHVPANRKRLGIARNGDRLRQDLFAVLLRTLTPMPFFNGVSEVLSEFMDDALLCCILSPSQESTTLVAWRVYCFLPCPSSFAQNARDAWLSVPRISVSNGRVIVFQPIYLGERTP